MGLVRNYIGKIVEMKLDERGLDPLVFDEEFLIKQNEVQYRANTEQILNFYRQKRPTGNYSQTHLFLREVMGNCPVLHFPLARIITQAMARLLFHETPQLQMTDEDGNPDEASQEVLDDCLGEDENNAVKLLKEAAEDASYSGAVAIVPTLDPDFSDRVIWQCYPRERMRPVFKYGRCVSVVTTDYVESPVKDEKELTLETTYDRYGITYRLMKGKDKNSQEVPLSYSPETAGLKPAYFANAPRSFRPFVYVESRTGKSDYDGSIDSFAAADELYSSLIDLMRKSHIKTYKPKSQAIKGEDGETHDGGDFDENVSLIPMANPTNAPYKVERDVVSVGDNVNSTMEAFNKCISLTLTNVGISPATIGIDSAGANASGEALNIREGVSLQTREELIRIWTHALKSLAKLSVCLSGATSVNGAVSVSGYDELTCSVHFPDYKAPTFDEKVASLSAALQAGLMDRMTALKELYPGKDDAELEKMLLDILGGMPITQEELYKKDEEEDEEDKSEDEEKDPKGDDEADKR